MTRMRSRGFTLVEMMVAVTIGLLLVAGLTSLLVSNVRTRAELDKASRQIENGRYALQILSEDLQHAGFVGGAPASPFAQVPPTACPANVAALGYVPQTNPGTSSVPFPVYALSSATPPSCVSNVRAGTGMAVVSRLSTSTTTLAAKAAAPTYVQLSNCASDTVPYAIGAGSGSFPLFQKDCATPELLRRVIQHVYFVADCNVCGSDTTPTLKMAEYVNGAMTVTPLVEGIEDFQLDYGVDTDGDGAPDCYTSNPASPPAAELLACPTLTPAYDWTNANANWSNVMAVRVHLLARNTDPSGGWSDGRTFDMGLTKPAAGPFADHMKRHAYSSVIRFYNASGQRE